MNVVIMKMVNWNVQNSTFLRTFVEVKTIETATIFSNYKHKSNRYKFSCIRKHLNCIYIPFIGIVDIVSECRVPVYFRLLLMS